MTNETAGTTDPGTRVQALDLLRMVAVLGVVLFHFGFRGPTVSGMTDVALPHLAFIARYGYLGVPVFFIISGFVIAYSAEGRTARTFAIARFARIYPTFLFCMTLTFLAVLLFGGPRFQTTFAQWLANLPVAAPALRQRYMDSAYWSLVVELTFYGWVALLIAAGLFHRRIDRIVAIWLCISILNEITIDARAVEVIFLADHSGFFATGLLLYQYYRGRRDIALQALLAVSVATAVFQAVHNLDWLRARTDMPFDSYIVAAICLFSILAIMQAMRIRRLPLPAGLMLAIGGMTYPLYLLHQQLGYVAYHWFDPARPAPAVALVVGVTALLSWATWRYVERPAQRWTKHMLSDITAGLGKPRATESTASI